MSFDAPNVGEGDVWIRRVAALGLFALIFWAFAVAPPEWWLTLVLHPAILAAYLLASATARMCVFYEVAGWSTRHAPRSRRARAVAPPRARGPPRSSH